MTRRSVYWGAMAVYVAASAMTLMSIIIPRWISWDISNASGTPIHYTYGLHQRCSSLTGECEHFPAASDCRGDERYFCSMWRSVGFLMNFAVVIEGMTFIAFLVMITGGKQRREGGWPVLSALLVFVAALQAVAMGLIAHLYENEDRFIPGWNLDASWILCTVSWCVMVAVAGGISASALLLEPEGGYELIPGEQ